MATQTTTTMIDRMDLQTGKTESTISLEEALNKLVPAYYMDRETAAEVLRDGQPLRTTAFEYRKADERARTKVEYALRCVNSHATHSSTGTCSADD